MAAASDAVRAAKKAKAEQISQNQIFRLAAMWSRVSPADVTPEQFEFVRFWFSVFSAIAVSLAGTVSALVYYAKQRIPGRFCCGRGSSQKSCEHAAPTTPASAGRSIAMCR